MRKFGIVTAYHQHEVTEAAITLAEMAKDRGIPATILARDVCRREVAKEWDDKVVDEKRVALRYWAADCNRIIWTHPPDLRELIQVSNYGIETCVLINWEVLLPEHEEIIQAADKIIIPYRCVGHALQRHWDLKPTRPIVMPWDVPVPITQQSKCKKTRKPFVYVPLYASQPGRADHAIFAIIRKVLDEVDDAEIVVACGRRWSIASRIAVKRLRRKFGKRIAIVLRPNVLQRLLLFARADLTVWAPRFESFGLIGLTSLCMGTPVFTWDIRPQNEYLTSRTNSVLVSCETTENWLGVPMVKKGYVKFGEELVSVLKDRTLLRKLKQNTSDGLVARRRQFEAGWAELIK